MALSLKTEPSEVRLGRYRISTHLPSDADALVGSGSGGPIVEIVVRGPRPEQAETVRVQAFQLYVRNRRRNAPEFSAWSKTGVSSYVQCRLRRIDGRYCLDVCYDSEVADTGVIRHPPRNLQHECTYGSSTGF